MGDSRDDDPLGAAACGKRRSAAVVQRRPGCGRFLCTYETHCVACHGAAAVAQQTWPAGLEPRPPYLLDATQRWTPGELFWIVKHGIKMTGMPSWRGTLSDAEVWEVVAWIEASRQLPPQTYSQWRADRRCLPAKLR